jgi:hypothetical protein
MPGVLTEKWKWKQMVAVTERLGLSTMKEAYDLHAVHTTILQKSNGCKPHSNNIHHLYNILKMVLINTETCRSKNKYVSEEHSVARGSW